MRSSGQGVFLMMFVIVVLGIGISSGLFGYILNGQDDWSPRNYVVDGNGCFVAPQGDPIYDEHYAKNVNNPNCQAFLTEQQAFYVEAQTEVIQQQTSQNGTMFGMGLFGGVIILLIILASAIVRGNSSSNSEVE